ncbi:MAG: hypothetical protein K2P12_04185 [Clostridia bacterium]|nr:hypothetical protein [Clostridia bacterium]
MKKKLSVLVIAVLLIAIFALAGCSPKDDGILDHYSIPQIDLDGTAMPANTADENKNLYGYKVVDDSIDYLAHPDAVMLDDGRMVIYYSKGHGKGALGGKVSEDNGETWQEIKGLPKTWENSMETPTIYKLQFNRGTEKEYSKYILISGCPTWGGRYKGNGFNVSLSDDGITGWTEFQNFYGLDFNGKKGKNFVAPIVAMASLTQLKDKNGNWTNSWMGFFHDDNAYNYKTILTFDEYGYMSWSAPEKYFSKYRDIEKKAFMCEVEVVRSDVGEGDQLCLIARSNGSNGSKELNSFISISNDEGKTWSAPKFVPAALNGERHKAEWIKDKDGNDRLFITFRSINKDIENLKKSTEKKGSGNGAWYSEGWVAWVGTYSDLINCKEGQYRIKLAHTYLPNQTKSVMNANGDTGYSGNIVFDNGTKIMTSTYGMFPVKRDKTIIASKVIDILKVDELVAKMKK